MLSFMFATLSLCLQVSWHQKRKMRVFWDPVHRMESLAKVDDCGQMPAAMSTVPDAGVGGGAC